MIFKASFSGSVTRGSYFLTKNAGVDSRFKRGSRSLSIFMKFYENLCNISKGNVKIY